MYSLAQDPKIPVIRCIREKKSLLDPQKNGNLLWLACAYSQNTTAVIVQKTTCFFFARDIRQSFVHPNANSEALFWTSSAAAMYCLFCELVVNMLVASFLHTGRANLGSILCCVLSDF